MSNADLGLDTSLAVNPFDLPRIVKPDVVLVTPDWYQWLASQGADVEDRIFSRLRAACSIIIGLEGHDAFRLWMPPSGLDRVDLLIKGGGLYRDRELYNYEVGAHYPGANWTGKSKPSIRTYTTSQLDKLRLSLPCFLGINNHIRARVRRKMLRFPPIQRALRRMGDLLSEFETLILGPLIAPRETLHCLVSLTHIARLELLISLRRAGVRGHHGVTSVTEYIGGTERLEEKASRADLDTIHATLNENGLLHPPLNRYQFKRSLRRHKAVIAPNGYGELTLRHGDTWEQGRALICPDLSHVETMYPFKNETNVIYCRPDFSDVNSILSKIENGELDSALIGRRGQEDWNKWSSDINDLLSRGIMDHLNEALRRPATMPARAR